MIVCRSEAEIARIRLAGKVVAGALRLASEMLRVGVTTDEIDKGVESFIRERHGRPAFKGYRGYPAATCISVNEQVVHGIPGSRRIRAGELVSIDVGVELNGYFADAAETFSLGKVDKGAKKLMAVGQAALKAGIEKARPGNYLYDISAAIQAVVEEAKFSVVREYVGHGIGRQMHEEPQIPNYAQTSRGPKLMPGMVLALEPMVNAGTYQVELMPDRWTVVTKDRRPSVHYEHTIAVTDEGPRVLTLLVD